MNLELNWATESPNSKENQKWHPRRSPSLRYSSIGGVSVSHTLTRTRDGMWGPDPREVACGVDHKRAYGLLEEFECREVFVIPRGFVHFRMNVGEEKMLVFTAFNSLMPGAIQVSRNLFGSSTPSVSNQILAKAFQVNETLVDQIKSKFAV